MSQHRELSKQELEIRFDSLPKFKTTMEIPPFKSIIGQNRAEKSIDLGLQIPKKGYNIFITGHSGTGKTGYLIKKIEEYAKDLEPSKDWCYVYNFKNPIRPIAISFESNTAKDFKDSLSEFITDLIKEVPTVFNDKQFEKQKNAIINKYEKLIMRDTDKLDEDAKNMNFVIKQSPSEGFVFIPMNNGKEMDSEFYNQLGEEEKDQLNESANELRLMSLEVIKETKAHEKQMELELKELDEKIANKIVSDRISILKNRYGSSDKINEYLDELKADIIKNIGFFVALSEDEPSTGEGGGSTVEIKNPELEKAFLSRYDINIIVNNSECKGAPVIFEDSPEHNNLFGKIEYENKGGNVVTDFTMIRPGSLHTANDGFIIMNAYQLLTNAHSWQNLKRCIKSEYITIENSKENLEIFPINTLKPENIPFKAKIILIGDEYAYSLLSSGDPDFNKLFKIKAEFDSMIDNNLENTRSLMGFISDYVTKNKILHISKEGVKEILSYSIRLAENVKYYASTMSKLTEVMDLANIFASNEGSKYIEAIHVSNAIREIDDMHGLIKKKILDMYRNRKYIVDFTGSKIGQINGLSVLDYGDCIIGQQHRITVATYAGKEGIIDIEREADMSGSIHSKGIMILSGYIGYLLGQDTSLSFNASIVFEQLYSGIEGDSASAAELIALLSSLSDMPIKQSLAITGSVNQRGEIQPIGGVIHKIEGFFNICSLFGLNGSHGVIIPETNVDELVLNQEVLDAIGKGLFHIYPVKTIEDCLHILSDEAFMAGSDLPLMSVIKHRIYEKLNKFNSILK